MRSVISIRSGLWQSLGLGAICAVNFFWRLGQPAVGLMEARNFVAAREMVQGGSWLLPTMNGVLRLAKPPLPTWAVAWVQSFTGPTTDLFWLRFPAAVMATVFVFAVWGLAEEIGRARTEATAAPLNAGWLAAVVAGTSVLTLTVGRDGQWDIFAYAFMVASLYGLLRAQRTGAVFLYLVTGVGLGASLMSKGPVAFYSMLVPFLGAYGVALRYKWLVAARPSYWGWGWLMATTFVVGGAWPLYGWQHVSAQLWHTGRQEVTSWQGRHVQHWWYYLNFPFFTGVWSLVALAVLVVPYARRRVSSVASYGFLLAWLVFALVLLSVVPEKKERYMLPLIPPLAMLIGALLQSWLSAPLAGLTTIDRSLLKSWALLMLLACLGGLGWVLLQPEWGRIGLGWLLAGGVTAVGGLFYVLFRRFSVVVLIAAVVVGFEAAIGGMLPLYYAHQNAKETGGLPTISGVANHLATVPVPWLSQGDLPIKQVWAAGRVVPRWQPDTTRLRICSFILLTPGYAKPSLGVGLAGVASTRIDSFYVGSNPHTDRWEVWLISLPSDCLTRRNPLPDLLQNTQHNR